MKSRYKRIKLKDGSTRDEHRLIIEKILGRKLKFNECVHHKDENTRNNSVENLEVMDRKDHSRLHLKREFLDRKPSNEERVKLCEMNSNVTKDEAIRIKYNGENTSKLINELNISKYIIYRIRSKKSWKHI